ncbi:hypothetical protein FOCC_FOCC005880 [Frankliniella occidentalis]|nr:hypothetical protein FOCC_FOCC005880 [Frankliniella occidentalis]
MRGVPVDVLCAVESDPPARIYRWKFNNSGETLDVPSERFSHNGTHSVLRYTAHSDHDYGTLTCAAENSVGVQQEPCVFTVISAMPLDSFPAINPGEWVPDMVVRLAKRAPR